MVSKDLSDALAALTEQSNPKAVEPAKPRGSAPAVESSALLGSSPSEKSGSFTTGGAKTVSSVDGLFAIYYPDTLKTTVSGAEMTIGVIKKVTP